MGNTIKNIGGAFGKKLVQIDNVENVTDKGIIRNQNKNMQDIEKLNVLLSRNTDQLGIELQIIGNPIIKNTRKWQHSLVNGVVTILAIYQSKLSKSQSFEIEIQQQKTLPKQQNRQIKNQLPIENVMQQQENIEQNILALHKSQNRKVRIQKGEKLTKIHIVLTLEDVYELKYIMSSFIQQQTQLQARRTQSQGKLCIVCLQNKPEKVLPCAHSYCQTCVVKYVLESDKKCPMCRKQFRQSLGRNIYQIVEWGQQQLQQMRNIFFRVIQRNNPKQLRLIKRIMRKNQRFNEKH